MRIRCALLCDAASVREGLLHVLGGGVTLAGRAQFPAPLDLAVALSFALASDEVKKDHQLRVRLLGEDGSELSTVAGEFQTVPVPKFHSQAEFGASIAVDPYPAVIPAPGKYSIEVSVNNVIMASLPLLVEQAKVEPRSEESQGRTAREDSD